MDRTTRGLLAGIIAGVVMNVWNLFDYYFLHFTGIRFLDWFAVLVTWTKPENGIQTVIYLVLQTIIWDGFLGAVFAHLVVSITSKGIVYKSTFYSAILWFLFKVIVNLYRVPVLSGKLSFSGRLSNFIAIILWGLIMGLMLEKFEKATKLQ
jgi:hypothetical protein